MNEKEKHEYLEKYHAEKEKGVPFFPDIIFKDAVITLVVFLILVALAYFKGAPLEAPANPADSSYTPRPEWYFLFLFQLLKYFPGKLEVIGVVLIPTLVILLLFGLPFLDRSSKRHFTHRPLIVGATILGVVGIMSLTYLSVREAPPPAEASGGDETAALYTKNCANCHGPSIKVEPGTNLHSVIAQGRHEGMPAWSSDLTSDQIDALAGFISSPGGSQLFTQNCATCHQVSQLVATDPGKLRSVFSQGTSFPAHSGQNIPADWSTVLNGEDQVKVLNFLSAPDGQRLFATNCSPCHGQSVSFSGSKDELTKIISQGGMHKDMPSWREKLSTDDINLLAKYVVDPASAPEAAVVFKTNCSSCHGDRIPQAKTVDEAYKTISTGGVHQTMPIWGQVLTAEQMDALVSYTLTAKDTISTDAGQRLFARNCAACHGQLGEGGPNPSNPSSFIPPISSSEFLKTRDDTTLAAIISFGQPNLGMTAFGNANGGSLSDDDVNAIVAYIRSWEANPPVQEPPENTTEELSLKGAEIYKQVCSQCHGDQGQGGVGPSLSDPSYQSKHTDEQIADAVGQGHSGSAMIAWKNILTDGQIKELVAFIRQMKPQEGKPTETPFPSGSAPSFSNDVMPIIEKRCTMCHGTAGGWDASSYDSFMNSGNHKPVVVPGDAAKSLLVQKLLGTADGSIMPIGDKLTDAQIKIITDWINGGALK